MVAKDYQKTKGSSTKAEVGEIDTSAPFQSVKDAVNLFGEGAFSGSGEKPAIRKTKPQSAERVLAKETQVHLTKKELNRLMDQLQNAESTKAQALIELQKAKKTVNELTQKLKSINDSKDSAIKAAENAKHQAKQFVEANEDSKGTDESSNVDLEASRVQYTAAAAELDATKQELRKIRQEYDAFIEAKDTSTKQAAEANIFVKGNTEKAVELSKEITVVQNSIQEVKFENKQTKEEEIKTCGEKEKLKQLYKSKLEESGRKLISLKKNVDLNVTKNLEIQFSETLSEIEALRSKMDGVRANDVVSVKNVTLELDGAKESLHKVVEEENSLRSMVETLKLDLDNVKKEHFELKEKETETESIAGNLHVKLRKAKSELEEALAEEAKVRGASDEMIASIRQLASESENSKLEAEKLKQQAEELKKEAEAAKIQLEEAEKKLKVAIQEAEEAKAAEIIALDRIKLLSEKTDAARTSISEPGSQITLSREEFESLSRKVEESEKIAEMKVAAAMAQVEAVKASENEAIKRLEATQKEIGDMKAATQEALRKAEMSEAAKKAVEGELRRWREREQKKAAETASRTLVETEKRFEESPRDYKIQNQKLPEKVVETRKLEKSKTALAKKVLIPSLTSVFHKKKSQVEGGSPSYLPGEKPVW